MEFIHKIRQLHDLVLSLVSEHELEKISITSGGILVLLDINNSF